MLERTCRQLQVYLSKRSRPTPTIRIKEEPGAFAWTTLMEKGAQEERNEKVNILQAINLAKDKAVHCGGGVR